MSGAVLDSEELAPSADLARRLVLAMIEWLDAGWKLGEFSSTAGTFFCTRGTERRIVAIQPIDPGSVPDSGMARLQGCPSCED